MPAGVFRRVPRSLRYLYSQHFPTSRDDLCEKPGLMLNYWEMMRSNIIRWIKQRCRYC